MIAFFVLVLLVVLCVIWFYLKADGDITLLFFEKCGRKLDLTGKTVWITGASSGIGEYLSYDCIRLGAKLVLSGVSAEKLENVKKNCLGIRSEADVLLLPFQIQDFSVHEKCVQQVIQHFGQIDVLVNNAGVSQRADFIDIDIEVDQRMFDINVFGTVNLTRKVLKHFFERNTGQFVVTSSMAGKLGAPFSSTYTGSKHALHGYFDGLRMELSHKNIDICLVCPGPVFSNLRSRCNTGKLNEVYNEKQQQNAAKMKTERCSYLMTVAMVNKLSECWICMQPLLLLYYFAQYAPALFKSVFIRFFFNAEKARALRSGER